MSLFLLFLLASFLHQSEGAVTASLNTQNSWNGGSVQQVVFKNSGPDPVCSVKFQLKLPSGVTIASSWNMDKAGNDQYTLPSWVKIPPGGQSTDPGIVLNGNGKPTVNVVSSSSCGGGGGNNPPPPSGGGNQPPPPSGGGNQPPPPSGGGNQPPPPSSSGGGCCPNGKLSVKGTQLVGADGNPVILRGMSLFWSNFPEGKPFFNEQTVKCLKCNWNANIVRAPMGVETVGGEKGYLENPTENYARLEAVVDAAIKNCMYVLVDWHYMSTNTYPEQAAQFFDRISKKCAGKCNCLYETFNEPTYVDWSSTLKPYHEKMINAIRKNDPDGVVIAGTPMWDQQLDKAAADPIRGQKNVMYTLHYYAGEHNDPLRKVTSDAVKAGLPVFVTEYGTTPASGDGTPNFDETNKWAAFLDQNKISSINWSIGNKAEQSSALQPGATAADVCKNDKDTSSGAFIKKMLKQKNPPQKGC